MTAGTQSYKRSQAGDFNSVPTTLPMTVIRDHASLTDAWEVTHPPSSHTSATSTSMPTPSQAIETFGVTADSPLNFYSAGKHLDAHASAWQGKRLDYILFRDPAPPLSPAAQLPSLVATGARVRLTEPVPGSPFSYSDHFGVSATLQIKYPGHARSPTTSNNELRMGQNQQMATISALSAPAPVQQSARLVAADASAVLGALTACYHYSRTRAKRHLSLFELSVGTGTLIFLVATASWFPTGATPFVVLGSAVATWLGTTMLYVGFVYGRWEVNALMNVIEEFELYQKSVETVARSGESEVSIKP
jgi:sphingomyelin phosphodiesterase 2